MWQLKVTDRDNGPVFQCEGPQSMVTECMIWLFPKTRLVGSGTNKWVYVNTQFNLVLSRSKDDDSYISEESA